MFIILIAACMRYSALFYYFIRKAKYMHMSECTGLVLDQMHQNNKDGFGSSNGVFVVRWQAQDGL